LATLAMCSKKVDRSSHERSLSVVMSSGSRKSLAILRPKNSHSAPTLASSAHRAATDRSVCLTGVRYSCTTSRTLMRSVCSSSSYRMPARVLGAGFSNAALAAAAASSAAFAAAASAAA